MKLTKGLAISSCLFVLFMASSVYADETVCQTGETRKTTFYSGVQMMSASQERGTLQRKDVYAGASFSPHDLIDLYASFHIGNTNFDYKLLSPDKTLTFQGAMVQLHEPWIQPGVRVRLLRTELISLHLWGDTEIPFSQDKPIELTHLVISSYKLGSLDTTQFFQNHVATTYSWYSFAVGTTLRLKLGKFEPRVDIGVRNFFGDLGLSMDMQSKSIMHVLGYDNAVKPSYSLNYTTPIVLLGADYHFTDWFSTSASGAALPSASGWILGANGYLKFHL